MHHEEYVIGQGRDSYHEPLWVSYVPRAGIQGVRICVQEGVGPHARSWMESPAEMFDARRLQWDVVEKNGIPTMTNPRLQRPGWFERKCAEAGCSWFVPFVRRMAAGEEIPLEEIQAAYREHNEGKEMPSGTWGSLFRE